MRGLLLPSLLATALAACGAPSEDSTADPGGAGPASGKADAAGPLYDGTPRVVGLLRFLNDPGTSRALLDDDVPLDVRAAQGLVAHRDGPDAEPGTTDDDPFDAVAEVLAIRWVGEVTAQRIATYATAEGYAPAGAEALGVFDGVSFTVDEAAGALRLVNAASEAELDDDARLDARAVASIVAACPLPSVLVLSRLPHVGPATLDRIKAYAGSSNTGHGAELGIVSDIDRTLLPPGGGETLPAPYPGVAALLDALEHRDGGLPGDTFYVTARTPDRLDGLREWMAEAGLPEGPIEGGISGSFWDAEAEKVRDISRIFEARPDQRFVLFGDSNHRDPEVYRAIITAFPDRVAAAFIHRVNNANPTRLDGLEVIDNYAEAAARLYELNLLDEDTARAVVDAARTEGLALDDAAAEALFQAP